MRHLTPDKRITIPVYHQVDTTPISHLISTSAFKKMHMKKQLGVSFLLFPGANHTRGEHLLSTYAQAKEFTDCQVRKGIISLDQARHINAAGCCHDLGHAPYSHLLEKAFGKSTSQWKDHNERTDYLIREVVTNALQDDDVDPGWVADIVAKKDPISEFISHKTLGADKIAYIRKDQYFAGYPNSALEIGDLADNLIYRNGVLGVDERLSSDLRDIQSHFFKMYRELYYRKQTRCLERQLERAVHLAFAHGYFNPDEVWEWTDGMLETRLIDGPGAIGAEAQRLFLGPYDSLKAAVVLHNQGHERSEISRNKPISVLPLENPDRFFDYYQDPACVLEAEGSVAELLKVDRMDVVITCLDDPKRLRARDVQIFDPSGQKIGTLFDRYPSHAKACDEFVQGAIAVRVFVRNEYRIKARDAAKDITDILYSTLK